VPVQANAAPAMTNDERAVAVHQKITELVAKIPDSSGDGIGILENILNVEKASDMIDLGSELPKIEQYFGHQLRIETVRKNKSDYVDGPDFYLIFEGVDTSTGEEIVTGCGGESVVATFAKLWDMGALPALCVFSKSEKPTARGYYPINVAVLAVSSTQTVDA
jgi:hypothetical protein